MYLTKTHIIDYNRLTVQTWTHGMDMDSWLRHGLMVLAKTHDMYIDLNSWHSIGTPESHRYHRDECCPYFLVEAESYVAICLH